MLVIPIAQTALLRESVKQSGYRGATNGPLPSAGDELAEVGGRVCYQSWERPNPATATNEGYLANILKQGHFSVLEHASMTFYVEGVSRALLTELERHRFLSFSVVSQRYVRQGRDRVVTPPAIEQHGFTQLYDNPDLDWDIRDEFEGAMDSAFDAYEWIATTLTDKGLPKKQALEAARSVLPNATEVKMLVTGNIRCWRDVIGKRYHEAADAEIREFSSEVLRHLRMYVPNSVSDIPEVPYS